MRSILLATAVTLLGTALSPAAQAQTPAAPAAAAPANDKFAGDWKGTFTTDGPSGEMTLTFTKDTKWKVTAVLGGDAPAAGEVRDLVIDGSKATWKQLFGEYDVTFVATLNAESTEITGTLDATQGGASVGGGSFTLARKA